METIVLYPAPGISHLISMVELGKSISRHRTTTTITILAAVPSFDTGAIEAYIDHISTTIPFITILKLPQIQVDLATLPSIEAAVFQVLNRSNPHVQTSLHSLKQQSTKIPAFIIDFFCTCALPIGKELDIPTYYYFTSSASCLALFFYTPTLHNNISKNFKDMGHELVNVPGIPPIPASQMVKPLLVRDSEAYNGFLEFCRCIPKSDGVIVNTFEALETRALKAIREGKCNPDHNSHTPQIFCVGPVMQENPPRGDKGEEDGTHECIKWLDARPSKSVVYLCFGSSSLLSARQLREIALGLEQISGFGFLWVVRSPDDKLTDPDSFLPTEFLDRIRDRGLVVVNSWVPQVAVLNHGSVGGFVTHGGWNSVLESIWAGVPMVAWPLYAEQHLNRVVLVEEMGFALRFNEDEDGLVTSNELEIVIRELMGCERGRKVRERVEKMSAEAKAATCVGGSSLVALQKLVELWNFS